MKGINKSLTILIVLFSLCFVTCKYGLGEGFYRKNPVKSRANALKELNDETTQNLLSSLGSKYDVLLISDLHFGKDESSQHERALFDWLDSLSADKRPSFCINLGDTADHGLSEEYDSYLVFQEQLRSKLKSPVVFNVLGNHDLFNSGWSSWKEKMYPNMSFYHFETNNVSWYFLDSGSGTLGERQVEILSDAIKHDSKQKIISLHYPLYGDKIDALMSHDSLQDEHETDMLFTLFA